MNLRTIIKEEIEDFDWIQDSSVEYGVEDLSVGDRVQTVVKPNGDDWFNNMNGTVTSIEPAEEGDITRPGREMKVHIEYDNGIDAVYPPTEKFKFIKLTESEEFDWIKNAEIILGGENQTFFEVGENYIIEKNGQEKMYTFLGTTCMSEKYKRKLLQQMHPSNHPYIMGRECYYDFVEGEYDYNSLARMLDKVEVKYSYAHGRRKPELTDKGVFQWVARWYKMDTISMKESSLIQAIKDGKIRTDEDSSERSWFTKLADYIFD